ncbi:MAG: penicillin-binding protein 1B, partial [Pseudomonadota bacterium]
MARKPKKNAGKPPKKSTKKTSGTRRPWIIRALGALAVVFLIYLGYLNHLINERFDGDTWVLPSRVFSRSLELYPGLKLDAKALEYELKLSSYLPVAGDPEPGQFRRLGNSLELHTRAFDFIDEPQAAQRIQVFFSLDRIDALVSSETSRELDLFRLPPVMLGSYYPDSGEDRLLLEEERIPQKLIDVLIAVEDHRFYEHFGVSPKAIVRALLANLKAGRTVQGGSTLTQQLAKNLFLTPEKSLIRKINEAFMSLLLEFRFSKQTIITAYINEVFLLQQNRIAIHGFERASRMLFSRSVEHLDARQLATLVGMVKGPSRYNPFRNPENAKDRRNLVLKIMLEHKLIDAIEYEIAIASDLGIAERLPGVNPFPAYLDLVKRQLARHYSSDDLALRGLQIHTPFDPLIQRNLESGMQQGLARFDNDSLQTAVMMIDYLNGDVQGMISDRVSDYPGFNRAILAQRPIGSLIKPLLLYSLLRSDLTLASRVSDAEIRIEQSDGKIWQPRNYDRKVHGEMILYDAFVKSYNLPFVRLGVEQGGLEALAQSLDKIGLLKHKVIYPSMLLGTTPMSAYEVTQMFQVIANSGYFTPLTAIRHVVDQQGKLLNSVPLESHKLFDQAAMIQLQRAMIGVTETGTARYLSNRFAGKTLAGKTGTTNDARDSWFAGFSQRQLAVVWMGRDDNQPVHLTGSSGALRLWADIMALQGFESFELGRDKGLKWHYIDPENGGRTREQCANSVLLPFPEQR